MTLQEIVYRYKNIRREGLQSQSESLSDRLIVNLINSYRAVLIKRDFDKGKYVTGNLIQNLGKVELIQADKNECNIVSDCILRTKNPIPKAVDTNQNNLIIYVGLLDGTQGFQRTTYQKAYYDQYAKYTGDLPKWYEIGNYIYIVNSPAKILKYINIQEIAEDPQEAKSFNTCGNTADCYEGYDFEYPMSETMVDTVLKMIAEEMKIVTNKPQDTLNNSKDD